jgi:signal transduction histidine kinase/ActR/RegA family two-component response regulator
MQRRALLLRDILLLTIGVLTLSIVFLAGQDIYEEWNKLTQVEELKQATFLGDQLFDASERISLERDIAFTLLYSPNGAALNDLRDQLMQSRQAVDSIMSKAGSSLEPYNSPALAPYLDENRKRFATLVKLRPQIDAAILLPVAKRDKDLPQLWFDTSTSLITQTQSMWMQFVKRFAYMDTTVMLHVRFKYMLGLVMENAGRQRSIIGRLLAENLDATPDQQAHLLKWEGKTDMAWSVADTLADQGGLYPAIAPYFQDAQSHYLTVHDMMKDIYVPGAHHGAAYAMNSEFWLDMANQTTDSFNALKDAALKQTQNYVNAFEIRARHMILYQSILLLFALALCGYSFQIVIYRVIRPINSIVEALINATQGKQVAIAPPTYSRQDEIGKLAFVLHAFQQNVAEIARTSKALNESESKLYQAQKMEAIGNLTGGMAHDFNNLLGVIIGNLDILLEQLAETPKVLAQAALDAALRGADLTRRLLAFARQQPLQPQRVDINNLVSGITKLLSRTLGENIEISLNLGPDIWPIVADPAQLEAAITNLATNARDAMPQGGKLIVSTLNTALDVDYAAQHTDVKPGDYAVIEVSDTGSGMPPEIVARIFEPFFTTKERGKGTGLGLAMVFGFIKQSGGHINVYSEVGSGTTFRLYLPRTTATATATSASNKMSAVPGGHETILVVEDNEAMRNVVMRQLGDLGYHVIEAGNAAKALEILTAGDKVDLLFTDVVMPGKLNGIELARLAREKWPKLKVVLTSGFPENKLSGHNEPLTGLRLLSKPYRREELARVIRETFEKPAGEPKR